ncbi:COPII-coated vesicle component Sec31 [Schizosaccharomyces japonicus yFS275]|uniref:Protein transport protein SEC31 n=1 Tax=Schizosaccharomyces japonicus (strain yFS275 / FY16936) TaxID=402676 RepID=B6K4J7_SCHJY|nr:COPII-coated vesicle component Sec31 [Schizosaccharomyces japonicus yFS275]EEB08404.1 COPII-coated vesicle component Sec31 [Schizosaccharomyces japonicus yFS275]
MRLKDISRNGTFAWSPAGVNKNQSLLAVAPFAGSGSSKEDEEANLELWDTSSETRAPLGKTSVESKFFDICWGKSESNPYGVIAGVQESGVVSLWNPENILNNDSGKCQIDSFSTGEGVLHKTLDVNRLQNNLMTTGDDKGDVWIWDMNDFKNPFTLPRQNRASEVRTVAWNNKVAHILASGSDSEYTTVWDMKARRQVLTLSYMGASTLSAATGGINCVCWHPENATRLVTAIDDNRNPVILTWDLRHPSAPESILTGHQKSVLSMSWCASDPRFLLSCGKDGSMLVWDTTTSECLGSFPRSGNWFTKSSWCPSNPNRVASTSLDGKVSIFSIQSSNIDKTQEANLQRAAAIDDNEFFNTLPTIAGSQEPSFSLKIAPKWSKVPVGGRFGFPNAFVHFNSTSSVVKIIPIEPDANEVEAAVVQVSENKDPASIEKFCGEQAEKADSDSSALNWKLLGEISKKAPRTRFLELLGFDLSFKKTTGSESVEGEKEAGAKDESSITPENNAENLSDADFFGSLAAAEPTAASPAESTSTQGSKFLPFSLPFNIYDEDTSSEENVITKAFIVGDVMSAVKKCLELERFADAFMLATFGDNACRKLVQETFYEKNSRTSSYLRLSTSVAEGDLKNTVRNAAITEWKDVFACICTYASTEEFQELCSELGNRLEQSDISDAANCAAFCYIAGQSLSSLVRLWLSEFNSATEKSDEEKEDVSIFTVYVQHISALLSKISMYRSLVSFKDPELTKDKDWKLADLYRVYLTYIRILISMNKLDVAKECLDLLPPKFDGVAEERERLFGKLNAPAAAPTVPAAAVPINKYAARPAPTSWGSIKPAGSMMPADYSRPVPSAMGPPPVVSPLGVPANAPPKVSRGSVDVSASTTMAGWNDAPIISRPQVRAAPTTSAIVSPFPSSGVTSPSYLSRTNSVSNLQPPPMGLHHGFHEPAPVPAPPKIGESYQPPKASVPKTTAAAAATPSSRPNPYAPQVSSPQMKPVGGKAAAPSSVPIPPPNPYAPQATMSPGLSTPSAQRPPRANVIPPPQNVQHGYAPQHAPSFTPAFAPPPMVNSPPQAPPAAVASATKKPIPVELKYPAGDRSHIPQNLMPIFEVLNGEITRISERAPKRIERVVIDTNKRLNMLFDRLNNDMLPENVTAELLNFVSAFSKGDLQEASAIHMNMITSMSDHCDHWIVGIGRLITLRKSTP